MKKLLTHTPKGIKIGKAHYSNKNAVSILSETHSILQSIK